MATLHVPSLVVGIVVAAAITATIALFADRGTRRDWIVAGGVALLLMALGIANLMTERPRETHVATAIVGAILPVVGATGITHSTRRARPWIRWPSVFLATLLLLLGGLLFGASVLPRFLGG